MFESLVDFPYLTELVSLTFIAIVIAITPGLDFILVTRNSVFHSRTAGIYSALGVGSALWVHVAYSIAGLAAVISQSVFIFSVIKYLGAAYLVYLGWKTIRPSAAGDTDIGEESGGDIVSIGRLSAFKMGFICNLFNPKAPIFFLSIFTQIVNPDTPLWLQITYGAIISFVHIVWFSLVAVFLSQPILMAKYTASKRTLEKVMGTVLIGFGLKVAASTQP